MCICNIWVYICMYACMRFAQGKLLGQRSAWIPVINVYMYVRLLCMHEYICMYACMRFAQEKLLGQRSACIPVIHVYMYVWLLYTYAYAYVHVYLFREDYWAREQHEFQELTCARTYVCIHGCVYICIHACMRAWNFLRGDDQGQGPARVTINDL